MEEHLLDEPADPGDEALLRKVAHDENTKQSHLLIDGRHVVRVQYQRPGDAENAERSVWLKVGPTPPFTLVPSILWLVLKIGIRSDCAPALVRTAASKSD